jgi:hypothetical protein
MTYKTRLQPGITLTSPSGKKFEAKWAGNSRSQEKSLGIFKTPGVKGVKIQDLEMGALSYPITIYFDGPDNDLDAEQFFSACSESGPWVVIHPVKGTKNLQLVSVSEAIQPITSGNITEITTEWIEVRLEKITKSISQLSGLAVFQNNALIASATEQLNKIVSLDTADKIGKFKRAVRETVTDFNVSLKAATDTVASVQAEADSIKRGIDSALDATVLDVLSLAGQIVALVQLPNQIVTSIESKINTYSRFAARILSDVPESPDISGVNTVAVKELALSCVIGAVGVASVRAELPSRQTVIDTIESNVDIFNTITDGLDSVQEIYGDELLARSYFSQSDSFPDAARMVGQTILYLIKSSLDLAVEKRITLTEPENPVMVAMREYGGPGSNDENIDLFYDSNKLSGQECYLLPVGKEIVVYI